MTDRSPGAEDMRCIEVVDLVTAYLDRAVDDAQRSRIERHLEGCEGCRAAVDQFQTVIGLAGQLSAADVAGIDPLIRNRLVATLRIPRRR